MKDFKFNDTFEKKLGEEKAKFIENLIEVGKLTEEKCRMLNNSASFEEFICDAFIWKDTYEGHKFWKKISKR